MLVLDDGTAIAETVAICRYFERITPRAEPVRQGRAGGGHGSKCGTGGWNSACSFPVAQIFRHLHPAMKELEVPQISAWAEANRPRVYDMLSLIDRELAGREFMAGDRFTIADITALGRHRFHEAREARAPARTGEFHPLV